MQELVMAWLIPHWVETTEWDAWSWQVAIFTSSFTIAIEMEQYGKISPFGDRSVFKIGLKYLNTNHTENQHIWSAKIFRYNIFVMHKVL